jgi:hypothetical protein
VEFCFEWKEWKGEKRAERIGSAVIGKKAWDDYAEEEDKKASVALA